MNANQNSLEIAPHTHQHGQHQKDKQAWGGYREKGTLAHCWWECKSVQPCGKQCGVFHTWVSIQRKQKHLLEKISAPPYSLKHYLQ